ncbi:MAG: hypothetical protein EXQ56_13700 [Acidobacteria bacterium]|nr:hypothetical protein [Acidobacteriota bacterium]
MPTRLGDIIDDYCTRCHMLTNNSVEALLGDAVAKVRCRTCGFSHDYKHGKVPEKKSKTKKTSKQAAYDEVLASVMSGMSLDSAETEEKPARSRREVEHHGLRTLAAARKKLDK